MNLDNIYQLKLGQQVLIDSNSSILRVPGGWVYNSLNGTCFIPFDNEFMETSGPVELAATDSQQLKAEIAEVRKYIENMRFSKMSAESILNHVDGTLRQLSAV